MRLPHNGETNMETRNTAPTKTFAYSLRSTRGGSHKYGPCERCGGHVDTTYLLTQMDEGVLKRKYPNVFKDDPNKAEQPEARGNAA